MAGVRGWQGCRAGHGRAVAAPRARFLERRQERGECSGDVNADIHGPCQAPRRRGCSQQLTWGRPGGEKGPRRWLGAVAQQPLPSAFKGAAKLRVRRLREPRGDASPTNCPGRVCSGGTAGEKFPRRWHGCCPAQGKGYSWERPRCRGWGWAAMVLQNRVWTSPVRAAGGFNLVLTGATPNSALLLRAVGWSPTAKSPQGGDEPGSWCKAAFPAPPRLGMDGIHPAKPWTAARPAPACSSGAGSGSCFPVGPWSRRWLLGCTYASAGPKDLTLQTAEADRRDGGIISAFYSWGAKPQGLRLVSTEALAVERDLNELFSLQ